jgi:hypothetical protein
VHCTPTKSDTTTMPVKIDGSRLSTVVSAHSHKYDPVRPKISQQHYYHDSGYNNVHAASTDKDVIASQPSNTLILPRILTGFVVSLDS